VAGWGTTELGRAGLGTAEAGGVELGMAEARRGQRVRLSGARPRQAGPMAGEHCGAWLGRGRHETAEGLGRPDVSEGRRGETRLVHAAGQGQRPVRAAGWG
jgi:hypothetical protein